MTRTPIIYSTKAEDIPPLLKAEINSQMTKLAVENEKVNLTLQEREAQKKQNEENKNSPRQLLIMDWSSMRLSWRQMG